MYEDISSSDPSAPIFDRREFLVSSIFAAGVFALAAQPIAAQTKITTDNQGLIEGEVKIPVNGGEIPAYRAMPDKKGKKFPVVIVVHEIFGVHEWIQDVCRRFAKLGFMAIAPALYARQGDVKSIKEIRELQRDIYSKIPDEQSMSDLDATIDYANKSGSGNDKKVSITGFCWGGRIVWLYAAHNPKIKAGAAWYGRLVAGTQVNPLQPKASIEYAKGLKVPVIGSYGALDNGITIDSINQMRAELAKGKSKSEINIYPNAQHGFLADYRTSYNKEASEKAWASVLEWFKKNGAM